MNYLKIILGNIFMTFAYAYIAVPFGIVNGGVTSFAMVLDKNLPGNISFWTNTLYLSLLIIYYIFMGYKCFINALFSCIAFILFFTLFTAFPLMLPLPFFLAVPCIGINRHRLLFLHLSPLYGTWIWYHSHNPARPQSENKSGVYYLYLQRNRTFERPFHLWNSFCYRRYHLQRTAKFCFKFTHKEK